MSRFTHAILHWHRGPGIGRIPALAPYTPEPIISATAAPTLVERERELSALAAALDGAASGRGGTLAVTGDPGIGKSRLLAAAREHARSAGMLVCAARGAELEHAFPFGVVRQLAASSYADTTREERESWFTGVARMAAPLFREDAIADDSAGASYPRLHALYWLCANAARRRPLVLLVDDAHWADEASLSPSPASSPAGSGSCRSRSCSHRGRPTAPRPPSSPASSQTPRRRPSAGRR